MPQPAMYRVPFRGKAAFFDVIDLRYRAICRQQVVNWVDAIGYLVDVLNQTPDVDHLTPAIRFYQCVDASLALFYYENFRFVVNDLIRTRLFVGYSRDGFSYRFRGPTGRHFKVTNIDPRPAPYLEAPAEEL